MRFGNWTMKYNFLSEIRLHLWILVWLATMTSIVLFFVFTRTVSHDLALLLISAYSFMCLLISNPCILHLDLMHVSA